MSTIEGLTKRVEQLETNLKPPVPELTDELKEGIVSLKRQAQALLREGRIELARKALDKAKEYERIAKGTNDARDQNHV